MTTKEKLVLARKIADIPVEERGEVLEIAKELAGGALVAKRKYKTKKTEAKKVTAKKKAKKVVAAPEEPAEK